MNTLLACAVCFGDANSQQAQNVGIFVMLGVTGVVLAGFVALAVYLWWRARRYQAAQEILSKIPEGLPEIG